MTTKCSEIWPGRRGVSQSAANASCAPEFARASAAAGGDEQDEAARRLDAEELLEWLEETRNRGHDDNAARALTKTAMDRAADARAGKAV